MSAKVGNVVSSQSAVNQTTSLTLSYTPTVSGIYRLNAYYDRTLTGSNSASLHFAWTDDQASWTYNPNNGPGQTIGANTFTVQPISILIRAVSGQPISLVYTVTSGTPSVDMYFVVEDLN